MIFSNLCSLNCRAGNSSRILFYITCNESGGFDVNFPKLFSPVTTPSIIYVIYYLFHSTISGHKQTTHQNSSLYSIFIFGFFFSLFVKPHKQNKTIFLHPFPNTNNELHPPPPLCCSCFVTTIVMMAFW